MPFDIPKCPAFLHLMEPMAGVAGCVSHDHSGPLPNDPFYAPVKADMPRQKIAEDGSIFQADMANSIYSDVKARRIGDDLRQSFVISCWCRKTDEIHPGLNRRQAQLLILFRG